jgi:hypothetical protein
MGAQYNFITSEAIMARITKAKDAGYSDKCLQAAIKCFDWCSKSTKVSNAGTIGASIQASIEMYYTTRQEAYKTFAIDRASELKKLQAIKQEGGAGGFFYTSSTNQEPFKQISDGCLEFLLFLSQKNSFGIVPYGLFSKQDTLGNKKTGKYWYRYFMDPRLSWWVGINANLASAGVGLMKASVILNDPELKALAQKQLDWIIGVNPFNSSTIMTVGRNQPTPMLGSEFKPPTPLLPGAVMNGLGGDVADQPHFIAENNYQQSEYWTPMVAYTIWLMAEISKAE